MLTEEEKLEAELAQKIDNRFAKVLHLYMRCIAKSIKLLGKTAQVDYDIVPDTGNHIVATINRKKKTNRVTSLHLQILTDGACFYLPPMYLLQLANYIVSELSESDSTTVSIFDVSELDVSLTQSVELQAFEWNSIISCQLNTLLLSVCSEYDLVVPTDLDTLFGLAIKVSKNFACDFRSELVVSAEGDWEAARLYINLTLPKSFDLSMLNQLLLYIVHCFYQSRVRSSASSHQAVVTEITEEKLTQIESTAYDAWESHWGDITVRYAILLCCDYLPMLHDMCTTLTEIFTEFDYPIRSYQLGGSKHFEVIHDDEIGWTLVLPDRFILRVAYNLAKDRVHPLMIYQNIALKLQEFEWSHSESIEVSFGFNTIQTTQLLHFATLKVFFELDALLMGELEEKCREILAAIRPQVSYVPDIEIVCCYNIRFVPTMSYSDFLFNLEDGQNGPVLRIYWDAIMLPRNMGSEQINSISQSIAAYLEDRLQSLS